MLAGMQTARIRMLFVESANRAAVIDFHVNGLFRTAKRASGFAFVYYIFTMLQQQQHQQQLQLHNTTTLNTTIPTIIHIKPFTP